MKIERNKKPETRPRARKDVSYNNKSNGQSNAYLYYHGNPVRPAMGERRTVKLGDVPTTRSMRRPWPALLLALVILIIIFELPVSTTPNIVIKAPNNFSMAIDTAMYSQASEHILSRSLGSRTKLTLNKSSFGIRLKQEFPEISQVNLAYSLFSYHPTVELSLEPPALVLKTSSGSYLLSKEGVVIANLGDQTRPKLPVVSDDTSQLATVGKALLPASYVRFITNVLYQLKANGLKVETLSIPQGKAELDLGVEGGSYIAEFNLEGDSREQAGAYMAARDYLRKNHKTAKHYLNVMVPGKVYYK